MAEQANFKRINFFEGFFTTDEDWNAAEGYHLEKRRLHNRVLHAPGVVPVAAGGLGSPRARRAISRSRSRRATASTGAATSWCCAIRR